MSCVAIRPSRSMPITSHSFDSPGPREIVAGCGARRGARRRAAVSGSMVASIVAEAFCVATSATGVASDSVAARAVKAWDAGLIGCVPVEDEDEDDEDDFGGVDASGGLFDGGGLCCGR